MSKADPLGETRDNLRQARADFEELRLLPREDCTLAIEALSLDDTRMMLFALILRSGNALILEEEA